MSLIFALVLIFVVFLIVPPAYFTNEPRYVASGLPIVFDEPISYTDGELRMDGGTLRVRDIIARPRSRGSSIRMCRGTVVSVIDDELADKCTYRERTPEIFNEYTMGFSVRDDSGVLLE